MVRLSDLPEHVRRQVEAAAGVKPRKGAVKGGGSTAIVGWCSTCDEPIPSAPAAERHHVASGHPRNTRVWPPPLVEDDPPAAPRCVP